MVFFTRCLVTLLFPLQMSIGIKAAAYQENTFNNNSLASDSFSEQANVYKNLVFSWLQV